MCRLVYIELDINYIYREEKGRLGILSGTLRDKGRSDNVDGKVPLYKQTSAANIVLERRGKIEKELMFTS